MKLLEQFISQAGKQPADWTSQDIEGYLNYVKAHVTNITDLGDRTRSIARKDLYLTEVCEL